MTVHELLRKVRFDDLLPILDSITRKRTPHSQAAYFKMAYDEMMLSAPDPDAGSFTVKRGEDGLLDGGSCYELEGDFWTSDLGSAAGVRVIASKKK